jgi:hypothetical protein
MQQSAEDKETLWKTKLIVHPILGILNWGFFKEKFGVFLEN